MTTTVPLEVLLGGWVAAGLTLFIFSFLYKDNPLFKLAEHLYVGVSLGYVIVKSYELVFRLVINPIADEGEWLRLIPVGIGTLMLARYVPKIAWGNHLAAGTPGVETWYVFGKDKYQFELGGGSTGVIAPGLYPLLRSGQINGLIGGLRGAAEYELLIGFEGSAAGGMDAQSATHMTIIVLVLLANLFYFISRRASQVSGQGSS